MKKSQLAKVIFIFFIISISKFAFSQTTESLLSKAYKHNSSIILDEFFYKWQREIQPNDYEEISNQSDTIKEVYNIYSAFQELYRTNKLDSLQLSYFYKHQANTKFLILQDTMEFVIEESNDFRKDFVQRLMTQDTIYKAYKRIIPAFRPVPKLAGIECVYLTQSYFWQFQKYFANDFSILSNSGYDSANADYSRKVKFLDPYMLIKYKGNIATPIIDLKRLITDPILETIVIYQDFRQAKVFFSIECGDYEALFEKINDKWILKECRLIGIC